MDWPRDSLDRTVTPGVLVNIVAEMDSQLVASLATRRDCYLGGSK